MVTYELKILGTKGGDENTPDFDCYREPLVCGSCSARTRLYQVNVGRTHRVAGVAFRLSSESEHLFCWDCLQEVADRTFEMQGLEDRSHAGFDNQTEAVRGLLATSRIVTGNDKISAIKSVRVLLGLGLKEAKDFVESAIRPAVTDPPGGAPAAPPAANGVSRT